MIVQDAIWSWWVQPVAVVDGSRLWVGSITADGANRLHRIVGETVDTVALGGAEDSDDHNATAIALSTRQQLLAFYARHNKETHVRMRTVDRDTLTVGAEEQITFSGNVSYAQTAVHNGTVWLFTRVGNTEWHYRKSDDWGATWGTERTLFVRVSGTGSPGQIYMTTRQSGGTVHFATVGHPSSSTWHTIGHCQASLTSGDITLADGTKVGNLDTGPALVLDELGEVFSPPSGDSTRLLDVGVVSGRPAVSYATWAEPSDPATYRVARWGPGWSSTDVVASGEPFGYLPEAKYVGGAVFDGDDLIVSREDAGTWTVERRALPSWTVSEELASSDQPKLVRPAVASGNVVWQRLHAYGGFTDYQADLETLDADGTDVDPGLSVAVIRRQVTWLGCDVTSGKVIAELPSLEGSVSRVIGAETEDSTSTPIPLAGPDAIGPQAFQATEPGRTMVVAVVNDVPAWAGWVTMRRGGTGAKLELGCVSPEGYLGRRFVRDHTFSQVDEALIMSTLAKDAETIEGVGQGLGLVHAVELTGILADDTYLASDHATVLDRMQERSKRRNGAEWTIDPEWADADHTAVQLVLRVTSRLGVASDAVFEVFDTQGSSATRYMLTEDWASGKAANWVVAYGSGEGDDQPVSDPAFDADALDAGAPIIERHWQPSSSITSQSVLDAHAEAELERRRLGLRKWDVSARWSEYPFYGVHWRLGDDVAFELKGHRHPDGVTGSARVVGWTLDLSAGLITPMLEAS